MVICHNSKFDRKFLEIQSPKDIQAIITKMPFACTVGDIDWKDRGYESSKLDYLNFKLGYFYDGHRALTDCWATFNLIINEPGAFEELTRNARKNEVLICAENAKYEKKDLLKERGYSWSDGSGELAKCWYIVIQEDLLDDECKFLDETIYSKAGESQKLKKYDVTAYNRYSARLSSLKV